MMRKGLGFIFLAGFVDFEFFFQENDFVAYWIFISPNV